MVVVVYVIMAVVSGGIHMAMSIFFSPPPPPRPRPLPSLAGITVSPAQVVNQLSPAVPLASLSIREIGAGLYFQAQPSQGKPLYVNATNGEPADLDADYAMQIAARHLSVPVQSLEQKAFLTKFDHEYLNIFRVLPAYKIDHPDSGQRVYVSTATGSVTLYLNPVRKFAQKSFTNLHKLGFIPHKPTRDLVQAVLLSGMLVTAIFGVILFFQSRRFRQR